VAHRERPPADRDVSPAPPASGDTAPPPPTVESAPSAPVVQSGAPIEVAVAAQTSERVHTVRAGESLWSIARAELGPGASAAEIAAYVRQLWSLNADRIGTGDPDLVRVGTHLLLPDA
jgi:nucleoid-associated protein YgaU